MVDIVVAVASKVAELLVAPVGRQCGYVMSPNSYVSQLKEELEKLGATKDELQNSIDEARNNMRPIKAKVEKWMKDVETITNKARNMLKNDGRAQKTCFYGWLPNPKARYRLGKEASKMVKDIRELISQGQFGKVDFKNPPPGLVGSAPDENSLAGDAGGTSHELIARGQFERVDSENPPEGLVGGAPDMNSSACDGGDTSTDSRALIFQLIMKALDDEKLKVIGVYGEGGVGKTTLLEEVEKKLREEGRTFSMIAKAKVSQTQDLKKIQDDIAYAFSLNLKDEPSEEGRRDLLFKRLQNDPNEKVLIILDDPWTELDLKTIGIPLKDESMGCKLLLISRSKDLLEQRMHADQTFHLEGLKEAEAFRLFEKMVGEKLKEDEELKAKAAQVVKKLAGLPLLITSVASTLKHSEVYKWDDMLIKIEDPNTERIVKWSYDHLKSKEAESLFLLCGLIGGTIKVELLLGLGMGLGLFRRSTVQSSRNRLNAMLDSLRSICLLQDGGDDKENVTIHDLYSEVVVSTPNFGGQNCLMMNSNYGSWSKEELEKCWAICLADEGSDRLAELMPCQFPDLKILVVSQSSRSVERYVAGDCCRLDFTYMKELQVLCLRSMDFANLPSSIEILRNLQSLYLNEVRVKDPAILGKLKALQILNLSGSMILRLPKEIGELTDLRSLNLSKCHLLKIIEPGVLKGLINLEELHMQGSFDQWMGEDETPSTSCNATLAELKSLTKLTSLEISIPNLTILLEEGDLPFGNLIRFWINIGNARSREFKGLRTMELNFEGCDSILSREWVQKTLQKTQYLHLDGLREFKKDTHELCIWGFSQLKHLHIQNSPSIKYIDNSSNGAFTILESLFLENLINLEKICHGLVAPGCFSKLKAVNVMKCNRLKYLWCLSQMQRLVQLEEIEVRECDSMRAIVTDDAGKHTVAADDKVEFPNVRRLELAKLPSMTSFCIGAGITSEGAPIQVSFPRLQSLVMVGFPDLEKILYSQPPLEFNNLKSIAIRNSQSVSSILKSEWILKLYNLESMIIESSQSTKVVFDLEELKVTGHVEFFSQLKTLRLRGLVNLQRIWKQDVQLQGISRFRNLKKIFVSETGLPFLFPMSVAKSLREVREIRVENCLNLQAIIVDEEGRDEETDDIIEFPLLKRLCIFNCPTEKFFSYSRGKEESVITSADSQDAYSDSFFDRKVSLPSLEELELDSVKPLKRIWQGELPKSSFCELATLDLKDCSGLLNVFPSTIIGRLHNLKNVQVSNSPSLESLFDCGSHDSNMEQTIVLLPSLVSIYVSSCASLESLFHCRSLDSNTEHKIVLLPKLKRVKVWDARRLRYVVMSDSQTVLGFPSLETISVVRCSKLRYLFPNYTATTLKKLEGLYISECQQMMGVVPKEEGGQSKANVMSFPSLVQLSIWQCHNFRALIPSPTSVKRQLDETADENDESPQPLFNEMVKFPNIRSLEIEGAQCKELWNNQIPADSFCKLESLKLEDCNNLQHIAPSHMWKRLQCCLEILEVISCHSMQIIYESDGTVATSSKLRRLVLHDLENLRYIWQYDGFPNIAFPHLRFIEARRCSRLEMLFPTFTAKFLGQIEELVVGSCEDMELIAGHEECKEATGTTVTFSKLTTLRLYNLPKFRSFLPEKYCAEFPSLEVFRRVSCGIEPDQSFGNEGETEEESEESEWEE